MRCQGLEIGLAQGRAVRKGHDRLAPGGVGKAGTLQCVGGEAEVAGAQENPSRATEGGAQRVGRVAHVKLGRRGQRVAVNILDREDDARRSRERLIPPEQILHADEHLERLGGRREAQFELALRVIAPAFAEGPPADLQRRAVDGLTLGDLAVARPPDAAGEEPRGGGFGTVEIGEEIEDVCDIDALCHGVRVGFMADVSSSRACRGCCVR